MYLENLYAGLSLIFYIKKNYFLFIVVLLFAFSFSVFCLKPFNMLLYLSCSRRICNHVHGTHIHRIKVFNTPQITNKNT